VREHEGAKKREKKKEERKPREENKRKGGERFFPSPLYEIFPSTQRMRSLLTHD
jgi:hypothetical protein